MEIILVFGLVAIIFTILGIGADVPEIIRDSKTTNLKKRAKRHIRGEAPSDIYTNGQGRFRCGDPSKRLHRLLNRDSDKSPFILDKLLQHKPSRDLIVNDIIYAIDNPDARWFRRYAKNKKEGLYIINNILKWDSLTTREKSDTFNFDYNVFNPRSSYHFTAISDLDVGQREENTLNKEGIKELLNDVYNNSTYVNPEEEKLLED